MAYQYDVFISYRRRKHSFVWLKDSFLEYFVPALQNEIIVKCKREMDRCFWDQIEVNSEIRTQWDDDNFGGIEPGANWRKSLATAIRASRCLVSIIEPVYFYSRWCEAEWKSFANRMAGDQAPIMSVVIYNGDGFPPYFKDIQRVDFQDYNLIGPALINGTKGEKFQIAIRGVAAKTAELVRDAPPYQEWPIIDPDPAPSPMPDVKKPSLANA